MSNFSVANFMWENFTMATPTYLRIFRPRGKALIRGLSANSSNIAFEVPLASKWWCDNSYLLLSMREIGQSLRDKQIGW